MTHTLAHTVAANAERHVTGTVYDAAAAAHVNACHPGKHNKATLDRLAAIRAADPAFQAAVDAAIGSEQDTIRRLGFQIEWLRAINLGALTVVEGIDPHANPGQIAADLGMVKIALGTSKDTTDA